MGNLREQVDALIAGHQSFLIKYLDVTRLPLKSSANSTSLERSAINLEFDKCFKLGGKPCETEMISFTWIRHSMYTSKTDALFFNYLSLLLR